MLFKLFGPRAYGRYVMFPILIGIILFVPVYRIYTLYDSSNNFEEILTAIVFGYVVGSFPSGYHIVNRLGNSFYKWTHRKKSSTTRIVDAIYDSRDRSFGGFAWVSTFFIFMKIVIKSALSIYIGPFCFPYIVYDLSREIHRTRKQHLKKKRNSYEGKRKQH